MGAGINWKYSQRRFSMSKNKFKYEVWWDGDLTTYKQEFDSIEEARMALALHNSRNARMKVSLINND